MMAGMEKARKIILVDSDPTARTSPQIRIGLARIATSLLDAEFLVQEVGQKGTTLDGRSRPVMPHNVLKSLVGNPDAELVAIGVPYAEGDNVSCRISLDTLIGMIRVIDRFRKATGRNIQIVLGGLGITLDTEGTLKFFVKELGERANNLVAVQGEGDLIMRDIALNPEGLMEDSRLWRVDHSGAILPGEHQALTSAELSSLPRFHQDFAPAGLEGARGCKRGCKYCVLRASGGKEIREFSPEAFVEDLEQILRHGDNMYKEITDNNFLDVGIEWWRKVYQLVADRGLLNILKYVDLKVAANFEDLRDLTDEDLILLKELGVKDIQIGVQSFDQEILRRNNRASTNHEQLKQFCIRCESLGITINVDIIIGLPTGSNDQDVIMEKTMGDIMQAFLLAPVARINIYEMSITRGSPLYEEGYDGSESLLGDNLCGRAMYVFAYIRWMQIIRTEISGEYMIGRKIEIQGGAQMHQLMRFHQGIRRMCASIINNLDTTETEKEKLRNMCGLNLEVEEIVVLYSNWRSQYYEALAKRDRIAEGDDIPEWAKLKIVGK